MKVLVIGKNGMLGNSIMRASRQWDHETIGFGREDLDITNEEDVKEKISQLNPDIIINTAGETNVDLCEENPEHALKANGYSAGYIAEAAELTNAKLIHFSTDYVFNGSNPQGYKEDARPGPINKYGESKLLAEELVETKSTKHFIIRVSWLFGSDLSEIPHRKDFINTIIEWSQNTDQLKILKGQIGKVTFVDDVANSLKEFISSQNYGIYHLCNEGELTRFDFAKKTFELYNPEITVSPATLEELNITWKAKRPEFSSLTNTKHKPLPQWEDALKRYLQKQYQIKAN